MGNNLSLNNARVRAYLLRSLRLETRVRHRALRLSRSIASLYQPPHWHNGDKLSVRQDVDTRGHRKYDNQCQRAMYDIAQSNHQQCGTHEDYGDDPKKQGS